MDRIHGWRTLGACFYRGGTSRGLVMKEPVLARYTQADRDRILCQASSPDPDGRQIDGLGGGTSSTSKVAIVNASASLVGSLARQEGIPLPGLEWIDDPDKATKVSDVVYRAGQVSIREQSIDWSSTCGNMMAAVAHFALGNMQIRTPSSIPATISSTQDDSEYIWPVRILAHDTGKVFTAHVPVIRRKYASGSGGKVGTLARYMPAQDGDTHIAGVPGMGPGIVIESPLMGSVLPTGNERDTIELDGKQLHVSIIDTGLPVVFVSAKSLDIPLSSLLEHPASIDSNVDLMAKLEQVRQRASRLASGLHLSAPSPKLCVLHPRCKYTTTGGVKVSEDSMDLLIRTVSTGQLHRSIPATTLAALAAATCFRNSVVAENIVDPFPCDASQAAMRGGESQAVTVGQPAGCSTATVKVQDDLPVSILMTRTARLILKGSVPIDPEIPVNASIRQYLGGT